MKGGETALPGLPDQLSANMNWTAYYTSMPTVAGRSQNTAPHQRAKGQMNDYIYSEDSRIVWKLDSNDVCVRIVLAAHHQG